MPDLKISQLPVATTPLAGTELVPIVQGGVTDRTTVQAIMTSTVPSGTANGVLYLNGSKVATSGSALVFDGSNLGLGVTPSAWISSYKALEVGNSLAMIGGSNAADFYYNAFINSGGSFIYRANDPASAYSLAAGQHRWYTAPSGTAGNAISFTQAMTLTSGGNLLVGRTSSAGAAYSLELDNNSTDNRIGMYVSGTVTGGLLATTNEIRMLGLGASTVLTFQTNGSERARITSGGDFGIGNTNPLYRLTVDKDTTSALAFFTNSNTSAPNGVYVDFSAASPNNATQYFLYCEDSTAQRANIRSNGGLANYQSNNVDLSDARTKKDIAPAASMWSKIGALEIVTYKYNDQTHDDVNVGVIAQQVEQVEPVWVDSDGFGETPEDGVPLKTVYTKDITFAAIKALQEAMTRIEQLEARVAALESQP